VGFEYEAVANGHMTSATRREYIPVGSTAASMLPMVSEIISPLTADRPCDDLVFFGYAGDG